MKQIYLVIAMTLLILLAMTLYTNTAVSEGFQTKPDTVPVPDNGIIPPGFYQIDRYTMAELPNDNVVSPLPNSFQGYTIPEGYYPVVINAKRWMAKVRTYDSNNYDIQYHDDIEDIIAQGGIYDLSFGTMLVNDAAGNMVAIPYVPGRALPIYNVPGSFVYGPSTYVPNYADSVYLSRSTGLSTVSTAVPVSSQMGGFCEHSKMNPTELEIQCNRLPTDVCASTKCCVLLGGHKCVSGDENGPTMKSNYTDPFIRNKDLYYYQGKCYGNCPR